MSRPSLATPCPAPCASSLLPIPVQGRRLSTLSTNGPADETLTTELDYTRAIQQEFQNARPRRRATFHRKQAAVTIFEDVAEDQEMAFDPAKSLTGKTLLSKPAQRIPNHRLSTTLEQDEGPAQPLKSIGQARKRNSIMPKEMTTDRDESFDIASGLKVNPISKGGLKKDPRRRTIFVPSEDTTMFTIHPGANTTNRLDDTFQVPNVKPRSYAPSAPALAELEENAPQEAMPRPRRPRMSFAVAPRRMPLQQMAANGNNVPGMDVMGQNGGKENSPPGYVQSFAEEAKPAKKVVRPVVEQPRAQSRLFAATAASQARQSVGMRKAVPLTNSQSLATSQRKSAMAQSRFDRSKNASAKNANQSASAAHIKARPTVSIKPTLRNGNSSCDFNSSKRPFSARPSIEEPGKKSRLLQYPVLSEDVPQPQLYEDSWLNQQEIALKELVNEIFDFTSPRLEAWSSQATSVRERMLEIYHQQDVTNIYKRLQASLLYGALSRPKDSPAVPCPSQDIGLRKRFIGLWLDNYDEESLRAAAEVVVGRQIMQKTRSLDACESLLDPSKSRRALAGFLDTFLVSVDDISKEDEPASHDVDGHRWRKMVIRSLMLIWLLDQAKVRNAMTGCLFKQTPRKKSSLLVLHGLAKLVIPSVGDIARVLRHTDYEIGHVQDPLDEVVYHIDNIAVDLRDGIFLNRLAETLLFQSRDMDQGRNGEATVTLVLPDKTVLESAIWQEDGSQCSRILSQHVKMPCLGRAQKLHNVQVALSAIDSFARGGDSVANDITADDIVDGHREKTLDLLWSLVSNFGLEMLIDWKLLVMDTRVAGGDSFDSDISESAQSHREQLLMSWVSAHATRYGVHVSNWTTSFADGRAYSALLDAFATALPAMDPVSRQSTSAHSLRDRQLRSLGCSSGFIKQLASTNYDNTIPTKTTTISNLAYLASRLLPLARRYHAAAMIQRAFRTRHARTIASRRVALMRLAHACATVVQTQDRLVSAATVLQRAWRGVLDARISRLNTDVVVFQMLARGWSMRRCVGRTAGAMSGVGAERQPGRVMGGW